MLSCLDDDGKVIYGKGKVIAKWEQKHGMHLMYNSAFEFADEIGLDPVIGMPRDFLHWSILGLSGYHIVKAIIYLISNTILADAYSTEHGNRRAPVNQQTMHHKARPTLCADGPRGPPSCISIRHRRPQAKSPRLSAQPPQKTELRFRRLHVSRDHFRP